MYRARAQVDLTANCRVLENLGKVFWSALVMADMGNLTLRELDKVYTDAQQRRNRDSLQNPPTTEPNAYYSNHPLSRPSRGLYALLVKTHTCAYTSTVFMLTIY